MRQGDTMALSKAQVRIIDCGIDWITVTCPKGSEKFESVTSVWWDIFKRRRLEIGIAEPATFLGYQGLKCDGIFVGNRFDGSMIRITGKYARQIWQGVPIGNGTITRLDVQVTVEWIGEGVHPARLAAMQAETANELLPTSRRRRIDEWKDNQDGYTTYIGSRQSASFSRTYHKSAQAPDEYGPNVYRYEVQFNKDSANPVHEALAAHLDELDRASIAIVWDWYEKRGVVPVFRRSDTLVEVKREVLPLTDVDKTLKWLYTQVRPTVERLLEQGERQAVLVALLGRSLGEEVNASLLAFDLAEYVPPLTIVEKQAFANRPPRAFDEEA